MGSVETDSDRLAHRNLIGEIVEEKEEKGRGGAKRKEKRRNRKDE